MNNNKVWKSLKNTITKMVPAVFTAMIATALGFVALYTSPVPMIQDFGKMLTIGIVVSFILAMFLLIPLLFIRDYFFSEEEKKQEQKQKEKRSDIRMNKVLDWITKKTVTIRWIIIPLALLTAVFGIWVDLDADAETDVENFMPQDTQALEDIHKLRDIVGTTEQLSIVYEGEDILSDEALSWVDQLTEALPEEYNSTVVETKSITDIVKQMNDGELPESENFAEQLADLPEGQRKLFLNDPETKGVITVGIIKMEAAELELFIDDLDIYLEENKLDAIETTVCGNEEVDEN